MAYNCPELRELQVVLPPQISRANYIREKLKAL